MDVIALRPVRHDERLQHTSGRLNLKHALKRQHHRIARAPCAARVQARAILGRCDNKVFTAPEARSTVLRSPPT